MVRASASHSVDLGFIPLSSHTKKLQKLSSHIHSFPAWHSAFRDGCGEQAGKFACCVLGQGAKRDAPNFMWKTGGPDTLEMATPKRVWMTCPNDSDTIRFLVNGG